MRVGLPYLEQIRQLVPEGGWVSKTISDIVAAITSGYHSQHNADDTHGTITATGSISERSRTVAMGDWVAQAFDATFFVGTGTMTWTVTSTTFSHYMYMRIGSTLWIDLRILASVLGGTGNSGLRVTLPQQLVVARDYNSVFHYLNGASSGGGLVEAIAGDAYVSLFRADGTSWSVASTATIHLQFALEVSLSTGTDSTIEAPTLTYAGTSSGSVNLLSVSALSFTAGTYTMTVNRTTTLTFKGAAGGGGGGGHSDARTASGSGGGGAAVTTGTLVQFVPGKTYTMVVGAGGSGAGTITANTVFGASTTLINTTDTVTLVSLAGGGNGGGFADHTGGTGGALVTGSNGVTGASGGAGTDSGGGGGNGGNTQASGCGGGGAGSPNSLAGAAGGNGVASGGAAGGAPGSNGGNNGGLAGSGGQANGVGGGGGGGGGYQITGVTGGFGGGGGGGGADGGGALAGGAGGNGIGFLMYVSAP